MSTYLISRLRIPGGDPNQEGLSHLDKVESTVKGGGWRRTQARTDTKVSWTLAPEWCIVGLTASAGEGLE